MLAAAEAETVVSVAEGAAGSSGAGGPTRRVRFASQMATSEHPSTASVEQMTLGAEEPRARPVSIQADGAGPSSASGAATLTDDLSPGEAVVGAAGGTMERLTDEEVIEQFAASGITAEPTVGSARDAVPSPGSSSLGNVLQHASIDDLKTQTVAQLASGALRLDARVVRTSNVLEEGLLADKIVTLFVIEVRQLAFKWEVQRRYSEFHRFHELLSLQWADLPPLPPKLLFSQECDDVAERMMALDEYLRALLGAPELALSPLVCTFLDAVDVQSFRVQMLPRLQQMEPEAGTASGAPVPMQEVALE